MADDIRIQAAFLVHFVPIMKKHLNNIAGSGRTPDFSLFLQSFPKLSDDKGAITLEEGKAAISALQNNKSPEPDNLTSEFYKMFTGVFAFALHEVILRRHMNSTFCPLHLERL